MRNLEGAQFVVVVNSKPCARGQGKNKNRYSSVNEGGGYIEDEDVF